MRLGNKPRQVDILKHHASTMARSSWPGAQQKLDWLPEATSTNATTHTEDLDDGKDSDEYIPLNHRGSGKQAIQPSSVCLASLQQRQTDNSCK